MNGKHEIVIAGAHRGQRAIVRHMPQEYVRSIKGGYIYDPEPGRSKELKFLWERVSPQASFLPFEKPIEDIVKDGNADKDSALLLTLDSIDSMAYVLENTGNPAQLQLLLQGQGSTSPILGFSGTITNDDHVTRAKIVKPHRSLSLRREYR